MKKVVLQATTGKQKAVKEKGRSLMWDSMNIAEWVRKWSALQPEKIAIYFENREISYHRLHTQVSKIALYFKKKGFLTGQRVAVLMDNCPEFIQIYLACAQRGLILVPINTRWAEDEVIWALGNCEPVAILFHKKYREKLVALHGSSSFAEILKIEISEDEANYLETFIQHSVDGMVVTDQNTFVPISPESPHVIIYTSGTTGWPKGAIVSLRKTFFNSLNAQLFMNLCTDDCMLLNVPLFHSGGLFINTSPILYTGGSLVIQTKFDAYATYQDIERYRVTKYSAVPTIMRKLLAVPMDMRADLSSLKICAVGSEKIADDLVKQCFEAGFPFYQIMGQTETSLILWASDKDLEAYPGTLGKPVFHAQVDVFDSNGNPTKPGEIGEIVVTGPTLMSGYWRMADDDNNRKIRNGWLHTGDMALKNEHGYYFMVERFKDMYISGGENVYPAEVERVLKTLDEISEVVVIGIPDPVWGQTGHAFVIKKPHAVISEEDIRSFSIERLARFKCPTKITFCEDFPRTALGKIMKEKVKAKFLDCSHERVHMGNV